MGISLIYSPERGTWNVIINDVEWYFEGTYEQCVEVAQRITAADPDDIPHKCDWDDDELVDDDIDFDLDEEDFEDFDD